MGRAVSIAHSVLRLVFTHKPPGGSLRWKKRAPWGRRPLAAEEWAVLHAEIFAEDLIAVDDAVEELTGFMDPFRADIHEGPLVGVTDGRLSVTKGEFYDERGRRGMKLSFYAAGAAADAGNTAFDRLNSAASALLDHLNAEGISVEAVRWTEADHIPRPF